MRNKKIAVVQKPKEQTKSVKFRKGFHASRDAFHRGHIGFTFEKEGNRYNLLSMTHDEKQRGNPAYFELEKNPDPKDNSPAFMRKNVEYTNRLGKRKEKWKLSTEDAQIVNGIIEKYVKKQKK